MQGKPVVVDASIVVKWVIPEAYTKQASMLRDDHLEGSITAYAPSLMLLEVASALRKYTLRGILDQAKAEKALSLIAEAGISLVQTDKRLASRALRLSIDTGITVYDATYIVVASLLDAPFYTADGKLLENARIRELGIVRHIADYAREAASP